MTPSGYPVPPRLLWVLLWALLMAVAVWTRPFLPVDETRYLAVAWEMWRDGNFLVPHLNGETYSHKPPLLFWLMNLGWAAFGLNDWWPRLAAPLFGLGSLYLTAALARTLWPDREDIAAAGPTILLGCIFWTLFTPLTMFDMMLALFAVLGLLGILRAWQGQRWTGFGLLAIAIALGVLAKGPAILLHVLPAALLAPVWGASRPQNHRPLGLRSWYLAILAATLVGAALALAWAIPAAIAGGDAYAEEIFWGQSAGRMVKSFAHAKPWWWYLTVTPPLVLPWLIWPAVWKAIGGRAAWQNHQGLRQALEDPGIKFCLAWFVPVFVTFSLISGKQLHYLLPIFPALALMLAFLLADTTALRQRIPIALFIVLSGIVLLAPILDGALDGVIRLPEQIKDLAQNWMILLLVLSIVAFVIPRRTLGSALTVLTVLSCTLVISVHLTLKPLLDKAYDLTPLAHELARLEAQGFPLAHVSKYHGQFHFMGRLKNPIAVIGQDNDSRILDWAKQTPKGKVITYQGTISTTAKPEFIHRFRRVFITIWDRDQILTDPSVAYRTQRKKSR